MLRDARANLAHFAADIDGQLQELVRANNALRRLDLSDAHLHLREIFNRDFVRSGLRRSARRACHRAAACRRRRYWLLRFAFHRFHPLYRFRFFDSRENGFWLADPSARQESSPVVLTDAGVKLQLRRGT